jgi:hypothetical protein
MTAAATGHSAVRGRLFTKVYDNRALASDYRIDGFWRSALAALLASAAVLYTIGLDRVPIHLHHDEIYFGTFAHSIAQTLRDPQGRLLPVLFQMDDTVNWYPPVLIYVTALWLTVLPLADATVRVPNAMVGALSVMLMFFVARRLCQRAWLGLIAAAMLALTPAHFINSRISTDSLYPVAFILGWLLLLQRYREQPSLPRLFAAMTVLGIGVYSYIASVVMMPIYAAMTGAVLLADRRPVRHWVVAAAGFSWVLVFGVVFVLTNPDIISQYQSKYALGDTATQLNAFQRMREWLTPWNISDLLNLFHSSFAPGYLFVTGGSNLAHSTREAGVFLAPLAVFLIAGTIAIVRHPSAFGVLALAGFITSPVAATIVPEAYAIPRMLGMLPFAILVATAGIQWLWRLTHAFPTQRIAATAAAAIGVTGVAYGLAIRFSAGALLLIALAAAVWVVGRACDRQRTWRPAIVGLLLLMPLQFVLFAADYFGDYRARSAGRYEYNIRGGLEQLMAWHDRSPGVNLYINDDTLFVRAFWEFYVRVHGRADLRTRPIWFNSENDIPPEAPPGSLILTDVNDRAMRKLTANPALTRVAEATDPEPGTGTERVTFVIFQKR